jgi:hypothetical protein
MAIHIRRRELIFTLGGAAAAWPLAARAQQGERMRRIGVLMPFSADDAESQTRIAAFSQALALSGWTIGRNVRIETRWGARVSNAFTVTRWNWPRSRPTSSSPMASRQSGRHACRAHFPVARRGREIVRRLAGQSRSRCFEVMESALGSLAPAQVQLASEALWIVSLGGRRVAAICNAR